MADEERIGVASAEEIRDRGKVFYATPEWVERQHVLGYRFEASPPLYVEGRRRCLVLQESWDRAQIERIELGSASSGASSSSGGGEVRSRDARSGSKKRSDEE